MDKEKWDKCVEFHGHECPALAAGYKVAEAASEKLGVKFSADDDIACVTENNACFVDAIQVLTGCTFGKGNLIFKDTGKQAFSFFNMENGDSVRIVIKPFSGDMDREERMKNIMNSSIDELFEFKKPTFQAPEIERIRASVECSICNERAAENRIKIKDGKEVCIDCFGE